VGTLRLEGLRLRGYPATFADAIRPIQAELGGLYWLVHGTPVGGCGSRGEPAPDWDEVFAWFLIEEDERRDLRLFAPGFATRYAPYIWGEENEVIGLRSPIRLSRVPPGFPADCDDFIREHAAIELACVGGTHWRMFTPDDRWCAAFTAVFPAAERCGMHRDDPGE
jgi:hypothetical protein